MTSRTTRIRRHVARTLEIMAGIAHIDDEFVEQCRARVLLRCANVDITRYRRKPAQKALAAVAKEAIASCFHDYYPDRDIRVTDHWPFAYCTITDEIATVDIWIGQDYEDDGDGVEPVKFHVERGKGGRDVTERIQAIFKRAPLRPLVLAQIIAPPPKVTAGALAAAKIESARAEPDAEPRPKSRLKGMVSEAAKKKTR